MDVDLQTRLTLDVTFGRRVPGSKTAEQYLQRIVSQTDDLEYERKHTRRTGSNGAFVECDILWNRPVEARTEAEELIDDLHATALGSYGYEHMEIVNIELVAPLPKEHVISTRENN